MFPARREKSASAQPPVLHHTKTSSDAFSALRLLPEGTRSPDPWEAPLIGETTKSDGKPIKGEGSEEMRCFCR